MTLNLMQPISLKEVLIPECHETVLRRFLKIIDMHAEIKNAEIVHKIYNPLKDQYIDFDTK